MVVDDIYKILGSDILFKSVGKRDCTEIENFLKAKTEREALDLWKQENFAQARIYAWEYMRENIVQNHSILPVWEKEFATAKEAVLSAILRSTKFRKMLIMHDVQLEEFAGELPFIGAIGELLVFKDEPYKNFFRVQLEIFRKGYWVCGWSRRFPNVYNVQAEESFVVY